MNDKLQSLTTALTMKGEFTEKINIVNKVAGVLLNLLKRIEHTWYKSILLITNDLCLFINLKQMPQMLDSILKLLIQLLNILKRKITIF